MVYAGRMLIEIIIPFAIVFSHIWSSFKIMTFLVDFFQFFSISKFIWISTQPAAAVYVNMKIFRLLEFKLHLIRSALNVFFPTWFIL